MKTLNIALVAATLLTVAGPALADSPTFKDQAENLWISTGDATYAHAAGLSDRQINEVKALPKATVSLDSPYSGND